MSSPIEFQNITKTFETDAGQTLALDDFTLNVRAGETLCLIGTSGSGKTTALKLINRLIEPTKGSLTISGKEIREFDVIELRRSIGYVIQRGGLFPHMTIRENIELLSTIEKRDSTNTLAKTKQLLEMVNLPFGEFADRRPGELSGGQQQRVSIARALAFEPEILLMDEPFGALDPITRNELHEEFVRIDKEIGTTTIIVTHDLHEAFKLGDRAALLDKGRLVQSGVRKDFVDSPENDFVEQFVTAQHLGGQE